MSSHEPETGETPTLAAAIGRRCRECGLTVTDARLEYSQVSNDNTRFASSEPGPFWVVLLPCGHEITTPDAWETLTTGAPQA